MAATRRNAMLIEEAREKIRTTQLINRLQNHALGEIEMTETQIKATAILLKKSVPDLAAVTISGDPDNPMLHEVSHSHAREFIASRILGAAARLGDQDDAGKLNGSAVH